MITVSELLLALAASAAEGDGDLLVSVVDKDGRESFASAATYDGTLHREAFRLYA